MSKRTEHPKTKTVVTEQDKGRCALALGSAGWSEIPCREGWWWDSDNRDWVEVGSGDLSTAIVDLDWRGLWYGPIIIPEKPNKH